MRGAVAPLAQSRLREWSGGRRPCAAPYPELVLVGPMSEAAHEAAARTQGRPFLRAGERKGAPAPGDPPHSAARGTARGGGEAHGGPAGTAGKRTDVAEPSARPVSETPTGFSHLLTLPCWSTITSIVSPPFWQRPCQVSFGPRLRLETLLQP